MNQGSRLAGWCIAVTAVDLQNDWAVIRNKTLFTILFDLYIYWNHPQQKQDLTFSINILSPIISQYLFCLTSFVFACHYFALPLAILLPVRTATVDSLFSFPQNTSFIILASSVSSVQWAFQLSHYENGQYYNLNVYLQNVPGYQSDTPVNSSWTVRNVMCAGTLAHKFHLSRRSQAHWARAGIMTDKKLGTSGPSIASHYNSQSYFIDSLSIVHYTMWWANQDVPVIEDIL